MEKNAEHWYAQLSKYKLHPWFSPVLYYGMVHWISFHACTGVLKHLVNASIAPTKDFCVHVQNHKVMANLSMSNGMTYKRI